MKKAVRFILIFTMIALLVGALSACGLWETRITSLSIDNPSDITMIVGETLELSVTVKPKSRTEKIQFKAETVDKNRNLLNDGSVVVTIDEKGKIKAVKDGYAKVTVQTSDGRLKESVFITATYAPVKEFNLKYEGKLNQYQSDGEPTEIKFTLTHGTVEVPKERIITWYRKVKDGETRELAEFADSLTATVKADNELGYYATVYAVMEYSGLKFTSNEVNYGYFRRYDTRYLTIDEPTGFIKDGSDFKVEASGVLDTNDYYFAESGEEITLTFKESIGGTNPNPNCQWLVLTSDDNFTKAQLDGADDTFTVIEGQTSKVLRFTPKEAGKRYAIRLKCDGVEAWREFLFKSTTALVKNLTLTDDNGAVESIQHASSIREITLTADWNKTSTAGTEYIKWFNDGVLIKQGKVKDSGILQYRFTPTEPATDVISGKIKVVVYDYYDELTDTFSGTYKEATYDWKVKKTLFAPKQTKVELLSGNAEQTDGSATEVVFKASITKPVDSANVTLPVYWYVNGKLVNGESGYSVDQTNKTLTFTPSSTKDMEYAVYAIIGNVKSNTGNVFRFASGWGNVASYCRDKFEWEGGSYNRYISSHIEACIAFSYVMANYDTVGLDFYIDPSLGYNSANFGQIYREILCNYYSGGSMPISYSINGNVLHINYNDSDEAIKEPTTSTTEQGTRDPAYDFKGVDIRYNYDEYKVRSALPIDNNEYSYSVKTSDALWRAVSFGYKPIVSDGTSVKEVYERARSVAKQICTDSMTDLEKVMAICDWLAINVVYDYTAANSSMPTQEALKYSCYYLEGVFGQKEEDGKIVWDGLAVCDGISKAFVLLCGLENIKAVRVVGTGDGGNHAWNKALIDADENGEAEWYSFDITWTSAKSSGSSVEHYYHNYLFQSENDMAASKHVERNVDCVYSVGEDSKHVVLQLYPTSVGVSLDVHSVYNFKVNKSYLKGSYDTSCLDGDYAVGDGRIDSATELAIALIHSYLQSEARGMNVYVVLKAGNYKFINGTSINAALLRSAINLIDISGVTISSDSNSLNNMFNSGNSSGDWLVRLIYTKN